MTADESDFLSSLEHGQEALRRSIETARELAEETERLIRRQRHRSDPEMCD